MSICVHIFFLFFLALSAIRMRFRASPLMGPHCLTLTNLAHGHDQDSKSAIANIEAHAGIPFI